jgi:hypothetical protein
MQSYAYYRKGSLAMFNVMSLIGEKQMNAFLGNFVSKYRFRERPYPSTLDFQKMLNEKLSPEQRELAGDQLSRITLFKNKVVSARGKKLADGSYEVKVKVELGKMYADSTGKNEKPVPFTGNIQLALLKEKSPKVKSDVLKVERMAMK